MVGSGFHFVNISVYTLVRAAYSSVLLLELLHKSQSLLASGFLFAVFIAESLELVGMGVMSLVSFRSVPWSGYYI